MAREKRLQAGDRLASMHAFFISYLADACSLPVCMIAGKARADAKSKKSGVIRTVANASQFDPEHRAEQVT